MKFGSHLAAYVAIAIGIADSYALNRFGIDYDLGLITIGFGALGIGVIQGARNGKNGTNGTS